jgi:hypothetical protein
MFDSQRGLTNNSFDPNEFLIHKNVGGTNIFDNEVEDRTPFTLCGILIFCMMLYDSG